MSVLESGLLARVVVALVVGLGLFAVVVFWSAGRLGWLEGWLYVAIVSAHLLINILYLMRVNPDLIVHRMQLGRGTKHWDKIWMAVFTPVFVTIYVVAGLDAGRFGWTAMSNWTWLAGLLLFVPGAALLTWAMAVNPFFEKTVRIQSERGHLVIDTGPYAFIRHPGYVGFCGWILSAPLLLRSGWALVPALVAVAALVVRTALEDKTLRRELTGYEAYASRVRCRLIPGLW